VDGKAAVKQDNRAALPPVAIVIAVVLVVGAAGFLYLDRASKQPPP